MSPSTSFSINFPAIRTLFLLLLMFSAVSGQRYDDSLPLGDRLPEWQVTDWFNSKPLKLKELKGDVVLVRWWTGPHCRFCIASSHALNEFHQEFSKDGLRIVAFYHHKSREPLSKEKVALNVESLDFVFPVAIDHEWRTLTDWWLDGGIRRFTSVTFIIDKNGVVRHIHPGGQYIKGDEEYKQIRRMIQTLLEEKV